MADLRKTVVQINTGTERFKRTVTDKHELPPSSARLPRLNSPQPSLAQDPQSPVPLGNDFAPLTAQLLEDSDEELAISPRAGLDIENSEDEAGSDEDQQQQEGQQQELQHASEQLRSGAGSGCRRDPLHSIRAQLQKQQDPLCSIVGRQRQVEAELAAFAQLVQRPCCQCPHCSSWGQHTAVQAGVPVKVYIGTQLALHSLTVNRWIRCSCCSQIFQLSPVHVSCLPGSDRAFELRPLVSGQLLWFSMDLLQNKDLSQYTHATSTYNFVRGRIQQWQCSHEAEQFNLDSFINTLTIGALATAGSVLPVSEDTLRRQLAAAVREYQFIDSQQLTIAEQLEGWPTPSSMPCAACLPGHIHAHFDVCYGLRLHNRGGLYTSDYPAPDNRRRFIDNAHVHAAAEQVDATSRRVACAPQQGLVHPQQQQQEVGSDAMQVDLTQLLQSGDQERQQLEHQQPQQQQQHRQLQQQLEQQQLPQQPEQQQLPQQQQQQQQQQRDLQQQQQQQQQQQPDAAGLMPVDERLSCSDFMADRTLVSKSKKYTISGVAFTVCRHSHVLSMMNCFGGERHAYGIISFWLLLMAGLVIHCWWYDINCRWKPSLLRFLEAKQLLSRVAGTLFPVPPWHLRVHRLSCRVKFGHLHMPGAGSCPEGEVCEQVNSVVARHGLNTQYMTPANREARLERVVLLRERDVDAGLAAQQVKKLLRVKAEQRTTDKAAATAQEDLRRLLTQAGRDPEQWVAAVAAAASVLEGRERLPTLGVEGEMVRCLLLLQQRHAVPEDGGDDTPPLDMLLPPSVVSSVKVTKKAVTTALATLTQLAKQHFGAEVPGLEHPAMKKGLNQWLDVSISTAEQELLTTLASVHYTEGLLDKLAGRPRERTKLVARKARLFQQATAQHKRLVSRCKWALQLADRWGDARRGEKRWSLDAELDSKLQQLAESTVQELYTADLPEAGTAAAACSVDAAAQKLYLLQLRAARIPEELQYLAAENRRVLEVYADRVVVLQSGAAVAHGGHRFLLLRELLRAQSMQARAQALLAAPEEPEAAAAVAELEVDV